MSPTSKPRRARFSTPPSASIIPLMPRNGTIRRCPRGLTPCWRCCSGVSKRRVSANGLNLTLDKPRRRQLCYPRMAALAFSAAAVIALFADFAPETASLTPIMKASWMGLDCGWKRIALARSTSAFCKLVSAAEAAWGPNAFLNPSLDQADRRVVASPAAAVCNDVGLLVAHSRNRNAARLFCDLELMHACQCDMKGTGERPSAWGKAAKVACVATRLFAGSEMSLARTLLSIAMAVLP